MARGNVLEVEGAATRDAGFLAPDEVAFAVVRGRTGATRLVGPPEEVFGRPEIRFRTLPLRITDYLGHGCLHCQAALDDPADMVLCLKKAAVVAVLHETCLKRWFVLQDKAGLGTYRFAYLEDRTLRAREGSARLVVDGAPAPAAGYEFAALRELDYGALADPGLRADGGYVKAASQKAPGDPKAAARGSDDLNILLCPRCDHPNKVPFLDTTSRVHACARCQGKFGVKILPL